MSEYGAYGSRMGAYLHLDNAPVLTVKTPKQAQLALTRLRSDRGIPMSEPIPVERAFLVTLQLRDLPSLRLWLGQRLIPTGPYLKGGVSILNLEDEPTISTTHAFDCLQFYIPRMALDEIASNHGTYRIENLEWPRAKADPNLNHLAMSILPAMEAPERASRIFIDQLTMALLAYCAHTYGGMRPADKIARGGLAPWQMRRATELLRERLDGEVSLSEVAAECELSVSHFARSFKQAVGQTPHRWLIHRRVDAAKHLLLNSGLGLSEIAVGCGFSDQSSFTRAFKRVAGTSPGDWRRSCKGRSTPSAGFLNLAAIPEQP